MKTEQLNSPQVVITPYIDIDPEAPTIILSRRERYIVKFPDGEFAAKNSAENINKGKPRYVKTSIRTIFNSPILANEAARFFQSKGVKCFVDEIKEMEEV